MAQMQCKGFIISKFLGAFERAPNHPLDGLLTVLMAPHQLAVLIFIFGMLASLTMWLHVSNLWHAYIIIIIIYVYSAKYILYCYRCRKINHWRPYHVSCIHILVIQYNFDNILLPNVIKTYVLGIFLGI
jgi:hypothetical protein